MWMLVSSTYSKLPDRSLPRATNDFGRTPQHALDPIRHLFFRDELVALDMVDSHLRLLPKLLNLL
jgi:hypothetical protein